MTTMKGFQQVQSTIEGEDFIRKKEKKFKLPTLPVHEYVIKCGKEHEGECLAGMNVWYFCKQLGHVGFICPVYKKKDDAKPSKPSSRRVYALNGKKAKDNNLIIVTCFANQEPFY